MRRTGLLLMAAMVALSLLVAACGTDSGDEANASDDAAETEVDTASDTEEETTEDDAATESGPITIVATEFAFEGPDTLPAGKVTIEMENKGKQPHELVMGELLDGKTIDDVNALLAKGDPGKPPKWFKTTGGTGAKPGGTGKLNADLTAGNYVFLCFVPDKESKKPHALLGMTKEVTVE